MLDAASPERLHPVFADVVGALEASPGGLDGFRRLGGRVLVALDGTEYHCSKKVSCANCSTGRRGKGEEIEEGADAGLGGAHGGYGVDRVKGRGPKRIVQPGFGQFEAHGGITLDDHPSAIELE